MKMNHDFEAKGRAAQHCAQLTARSPRPEERTALMVAWRRDLAGILAEDLSKMLSGDRLNVTVSEPERLTGADVFARIGPVAANSLLRCGPGAELVLLSFDFATAMALTDRSFGGDGALLTHAPDRLPGSAALMVSEIAAVMARAVTRARMGRAGIAAKGEADASAMKLVESAARLKPFDADARVLVFCVSIANAAGQEWTALLCTAADRMERLLPAQGPGAASAGRRADRKTIGSSPATYGSIPLPLRVVLADVDLSLAALHRLQPGNIIPLTIARQAPLKTGDQTIALGTIGTSEERMAIRITRIPAEGSQP